MEEDTGVGPKRRRRGGSARTAARRGDGRRIVRSVLEAGRPISHQQFRGGGRQTNFVVVVVAGDVSVRRRVHAGRRRNFPRPSLRDVVAVVIEGVVVLDARSRRRNASRHVGKDPLGMRAGRAPRISAGNRHEGAVVYWGGHATLSRNGAMAVGPVVRGRLESLPGLQNQLSGGVRPQAIERAPLRQVRREDIAASPVLQNAGVEVDEQGNTLRFQHRKRWTQNEGAGFGSDLSGEPAPSRGRGDGTPPGKMEVVPSSVSSDVVVGEASWSESSARAFRHRGAQQGSETCDRVRQGIVPPPGPLSFAQQERRVGVAVLRLRGGDRAVCLFWGRGIIWTD
mmetsp:Transcript_18731/g.40171  ORF Transcript_18731/g.40171 Transcript_18731/m.40171 type:complete len:339 (+) Transcript_18731:431-1447(+)